METHLDYNIAETFDFESLSNHSYYYDLFIQFHLVVGAETSQSLILLVIMLFHETYP